MKESEGRRKETKGEEGDGRIRGRGSGKQFIGGGRKGRKTKGYMRGENEG